MRSMAETVTVLLITSDRPFRSSDDEGRCRETTVKAISSHVLVFIEHGRLRPADERDLRAPRRHLRRELPW